MEPAKWKVIGLALLSATHRSPYSFIWEQVLSNLKLLLYEILMYHYITKNQLKIIYRILEINNEFSILT